MGASLSLSGVIQHFWCVRRIAKMYQWQPSGIPGQFNFIDITQTNPQPLAVAQQLAGVFICVGIGNPRGRIPAPAGSLFLCTGIGATSSPPITLGTGVPGEGALPGVKVRLWDGGQDVKDSLSGDFNPRGAWSNVTIYAQYDLVTYNGNSYVSQVVGNNSGFQPDITPTKWSRLNLDSDATLAAGSAEISTIPVCVYFKYFGDATDANYWASIPGTDPLNNKRIGGV